jgi:hypothetical protein
VRKVAHFSDQALSRVITSAILNSIGEKQGRKMTDHNQDRAKAAINELQQQLRDAYDAVLRLKRDVPSENFPTAYEMSHTIRDLRKAVELLRTQLNDETVELDIDFSLLNERFNSSESSASIC